MSFATSTLAKAGYILQVSISDEPVALGVPARVAVAQAAEEGRRRPRRPAGGPGGPKGPQGLSSSSSLQDIKATASFLVERRERQR